MVGWGQLQITGLLGRVSEISTCLIFLQPLPTRESDPNFKPLATGLSVNLTACQLHFLACRLIKQAFL